MQRVDYYSTSRGSGRGHHAWHGWWWRCTHARWWSSGSTCSWAWWWWWHPWWWWSGHRGRHPTWRHNRKKMELTTTTNMFTVHEECSHVALQKVTDLVEVASLEVAWRVGVQEVEAYPLGVEEHPLEGALEGASCQTGVVVALQRKMNVTAWKWTLTCGSYTQWRLASRFSIHGEWGNCLTWHACGRGWWWYHTSWHARARLWRGGRRICKQLMWSVSLRQGVLLR